jgi:murein DD-endopeptidase MepM/ murein hydrolase activator NlpD
MKIIQLLYVLFSLGVSSHWINARYGHICSNSNESVVKFRKKMHGQSSHQDALKICVADQILGKHEVLFDWPIDLCEFWVSSLFGPRTHHGVTKMHGGIDMAAGNGTAVKAAADGVVIRSEESVPGYGTVVEIKHAHGFVTRYGHLEEIWVNKHDKVVQGDQIGTVGSTGNVRGKRDPSHLHFEIILNNEKVNPLKYLYCSEVAFVSK